MNFSMTVPSSPVRRGEKSGGLACHLVTEVFLTRARGGNGLLDPMDMESILFAGSGPLMAVS